MATGEVVSLVAILISVAALILNIFAYYTIRKARKDQHENR